jgi:hypothetical protein
MLLWHPQAADNRPLDPTLHYDFETQHRNFYQPLSVEQGRVQAAVFFGFGPSYTPPITAHHIFQILFSGVNQILNHFINHARPAFLQSFPNGLLRLFAYSRPSYPQVFFLRSARIGVEE